jgi:hypothetical protein
MEKTRIINGSVMRCMLVDLLITPASLEKDSAIVRSTPGNAVLTVSVDQTLERHNEAGFSAAVLSLPPAMPGSRIEVDLPKDSPGVLANPALPSSDEAIGVVLFGQVHGDRRLEVPSSWTRQ